MHMNILVTLDENYLPHLRTMLFSLYLNNPYRSCHVFLLYSNIPESKTDILRENMRCLGYDLTTIHVGDALFQDVPVTDRYPKEMYYRLLASQFLPTDVDRVLYLDPDLLVINSLNELWNTDLKQSMFAAASHSTGDGVATNVNRLRLDTTSAYYNSGVLLMDLEKCRERIEPGEVFAYVKTHAGTILLPDQDVLNALYGETILPLDDLIWNYDARKYNYNYFRSGGKATPDWVIDHTAILHFCGRAKPWRDGYRYRFGILYRHYMQLERRFFRDLGCG